MLKILSGVEKIYMPKTKKEKRKHLAANILILKPGVQALHLDSWSGVLCTAASKTLLQALVIRCLWCVFVCV